MEECVLSLPDPETLKALAILVTAVGGAVATVAASVGQLFKRKPPDPPPQAKP